MTSKTNKSNNSYNIPPILEPNFALIIWKAKECFWGVTDQRLEETLIQQLIWSLRLPGNITGKTLRLNLRAHFGNSIWASTVPPIGPHVQAVSMIPFSLITQKRQNLFSDKKQLFSFLFSIISNFTLNISYYCWSI